MKRHEKNDGIVSFFFPCQTELVFSAARCCMEYSGPCLLMGCPKWDLACASFFVSQLLYMRECLLVNEYILQSVMSNVDSACMGGLIEFSAISLRLVDKRLNLLVAR